MYLGEFIFATTVSRYLPWVRMRSVAIRMGRFQLTSSEVNSADSSVTHALTHLLTAAVSHSASLLNPSVWQIKQSEYLQFA